MGGRFNRSSYLIHDPYSNTQRLTVPFTISVETSTGSGYDDLPSGYMFTVVVTAEPKSFNDLFDIDAVEARVSAVKP